MQEAAAEKFDELFEVEVSENSDAKVGKMLANIPQDESERCGTRTHDDLIKSYGVILLNLRRLLDSCFDSLIESTPEGKKKI